MGKADIEAVQKQGQISGNPWSFESERMRRIAAEEKSRDTLASIEKITGTLLEAAHPNELPPIYSVDDSFNIQFRLGNADVYRRFYQQRNQHISEIRELVTWSQQQIEERDRDLDKDFDC